MQSAADLDSFIREKTATMVIYRKQRRKIAGPQGFEVGAVSDYLEWFEDIYFPSEAMAELGLKTGTIVTRNEDALINAGV